MKAYSKYIALAAVAVSFAACQQEEMDITSQDDLVRIEATIGNLPQTRVTYSGDECLTNFDTGDKIRVVNTQRDGKGKDAATYQYASDSNGGLIWEIYEGSLVWNGGENYNQFNAWYPVTATYSSFTITNITGTTKLADNDWMTATTDQMYKQDKLTLQFKHRLTMVTVSVTEWGDEIDEGNRSLTSAEIYTPTAITWDGTNTEGTTNSWITPYVNTSSSYLRAIICPGEPATENDYWLKVTAADGNIYNVKPISGTTLVAGKHYKFNLKVGKDKAVIESVTVKDWTDGGEITAPDAIEKE